LLRRHAQESHCSPVHQLLFNSVDPQCGNLLASLGKTQVGRMSHVWRMCAGAKAAAANIDCPHRRNMTSANVTVAGNDLRRPAYGQLHRRGSALHE